ANASLKQIEWNFNQKIKTSKISPTQIFNNPGRHLIEAVALAEGGYFRKIGRYISVSPQKINNGQIIVFNFAGSANAPSKIDALVDMRKVTLSKSKQDPELYISEFKLDLTQGSKSIVIPYFLYQAMFNLVIMPKIANPEQYIDQQIDTITNLISTNQNGEPVDQFQQNLLNLLDEVEVKVKQLSPVQKQELASLLQANLSEQLQQIVVQDTSVHKKESNTILDFFIGSASAGIIPEDTTMQDKITVAYMFQYLIYGTIGIAMGVDALNVGITHITKNYIFGTIAILAGSYIIYQTLKAEQALLRRIFLPLNKVLLELMSIGSAQSAEIFYTQVKANMKGIGYSDSNSSVEDIREVISVTNSINKTLLPAQILIAETNNLLASFLFNSRIEELPSLEFPLGSIDSYLSTDYMSVSVLKSDYGNVSLNVTKNGPNLGIKLTSTTTQNVTLRIRYTNVLLNAEGFKDIDVLVVTDPPKAIINYQASNLKVDFDSTDPSNPNLSGLTYNWDFGNGDSLTTESKSFTYTYPTSGTFNVKLIVTDSFGISSHKELTLTVSSPVINGWQVIICNASAVPGDMLFQIPGNAPFVLTSSISDGSAFDINKPFVDHDCECKIIIFPKNVTTWYTLTPYPYNYISFDPNLITTEPWNFGFPHNSNLYKEFTMSILGASGPDTYRTIPFEEKKNPNMTCHYKYK
ncbi:MAG: PKD domain-containing protein, partial [Bdellovibrionales bacterium]|nr:PKD domain-containing protein [Bdellovibrionales bacterium]